MGQRSVFKGDFRCVTRGAAALAKAAVFCGALMATASSALADTKAITFGKLIDGTGRVIDGAIVLVENDRVQRVTTDRSQIPAGATVIDLSRYTGIPGMIDSHTHISFYWDGAKGTSPRNQPALSPIITTFLIRENLRKALEAGVTTIRDLNAPDGIDLAMRDLIRMGQVTGPRMFVSGLGIRMTRVGAGIIGMQVDGVPEILHAVRQVYGSGADWVKLYNSSGGFNDVTQNQHFTFEEIKAAVDQTHQLQRRIAIHSYGPAGAKDAVRAGVDSLEHGTDLDDETIADMVKRGTYYVPTIDHNQYYVENADDYFFFPPGSKEGLSDFIRRNYETAQKAFKAGVRMVAGSDAVFNGWGLNMRELEWFVKMGMTPAQALKTATTTPAAMLGMEKSLGAVAPGFLADIVAVDGDPLANITVVTSKDKVRWVMKGGQVVVDKTTATR